MTIGAMVEYFENKGFKVRKTYLSLDKKYEFQIEKDGCGLTGWFQWPTDGTPGWVAQRNFLDNMIRDFEKGKKDNKMKNIAFDISRDGPVGKLVIKDNVYDVCVKEVDSYSSPYDTNTVLKVEVSGKNLFEPKCSTRTDGIMAQIEAYKVMTTYNPTRKDSINEGKLQIKDVILNPPATIVFWSDGSKTVVKAENEIYDPEKGLAMALAKRALGNQGNYFETFKKYVEPYKKKVEDERASKIAEVNAALDRPYRIWYSYYHTSDGSLAGSGVYHKEYMRKCDASRVAKKRYVGNDNITVRWVVARENPWISGEWAKKFGSDS